MAPLAPWAQAGGPPSYRAMYAGAPDKIHTVAIDYRGFGSITGSPSEAGLLIDALTLADWAMNEAEIPSSRIVLFGQSLGTAVSISLAKHLVAEPEPILFAGMILVAPFADVELLTATYRLGGMGPLLSPVARHPSLLAYLNTFVSSKWMSKNSLADFGQRCEQLSGDDLKYHITIIHAEDDYDIPWTHSEQVFWHAVNASTPSGITFDDLEARKGATKIDLGAGGWVVNHQGTKGTIKEHVTTYSLHDRIMSYPVVSMAILRAFNGDISTVGSSEHR